MIPQKRRYIRKKQNIVYMAYACHLSCLGFSLIHENMSNIIAHNIIILYECVIYYHTISPTFCYPTLESAPVVCWHNNIIRQTRDRVFRGVCKISKCRKKHSCDLSEKQTFPFIMEWLLHTARRKREQSLFQHWLHCHIDGTWGTLPMASVYVLPNYSEMACLFPTVIKNRIWYFL